MYIMFGVQQSLIHPNNHRLQIRPKFVRDTWSRLQLENRHTKEIENNMAGILKGAQAKLNCGIISKKEYDDIRSIVSVAEYEAFFPMLYIVESKKVKDRCDIVKIS